MLAVSGQARFGRLGVCADDGVDIIPINIAARGTGRIITDEDGMAVVNGRQTNIFCNT